MRRGLKSAADTAEEGWFDRFTGFPDEEGTEIFMCWSIAACPISASQDSPMRRGLKY